MLGALAAIGVAAGFSTTISGVGGALIALAATSLLMPSRAALAVTSAALLIGSVHRVWIYRRDIAAGLALRLGGGIVAGALAGAPLVTRLPELALRVALVVVSALAIAAALAELVVRLSPRAMIASGFAIGVIGASAGGAALLIGPVLQAVGARGVRYIATCAAIAAIFNLARIAGYFTAGLYAPTMGGDVAMLAGACIVGNLLGAIVRRRISVRVTRGIELGAPVIALVLALVGA